MAAGRRWLATEVDSHDDFKPQVCVSPPRSMRRTVFWQFPLLYRGQQGATCCYTTLVACPCAPQVKGGAAAGVKDTIERDVAGHDVFIYMKARRCWPALLELPQHHLGWCCQRAAGVEPCMRDARVGIACQPPSLAERCARAACRSPAACLAAPPSPLAQGVPQAPMCGFSNMACAILNLYGALLLSCGRWLGVPTCRATGGCGTWCGFRTCCCCGVRGACNCSTPDWKPVYRLHVCLPGRLAQRAARTRALLTSTCLNGSVAAHSAGVEYGARNVLADPEIREGIKQFTHWPTIPQASRAASLCL